MQGARESHQPILLVGLIEYLHPMKALTKGRDQLGLARLIEMVRIAWIPPASLPIRHGNDHLTLGTKTATHLLNRWNVVAKMFQNLEADDVRKCSVREGQLSRIDLNDFRPASRARPSRFR